MYKVKICYDDYFERIHKFDDALEFMERLKRARDQVSELGYDSSIIFWKRQGCHFTIISADEEKTFEDAICVVIQTVANPNFIKIDENLHNKEPLRDSIETRCSLDLD